MGFITDKPLVMLRPSDLTVYTSFSVQPYICPATVVDKYNVGRAIRYNFKFDDGVVSGSVLIKKMFVFAIFCVLQNFRQKGTYIVMVYKYSSIYSIKQQCKTIKS